MLALPSPRMPLVESSEVSIAPGTGNAAAKTGPNRRLDYRVVGQRRGRSGLRIASDENPSDRLNGMGHSHWLQIFYSRVAVRRHVDRRRYGRRQLS